VQTGDVLIGLNGGGCPGQVNIVHPYSTGGAPTLVQPPDNTCTVTMNGDTSVAGSFGGVMRVIDATNAPVNFIPDPGGSECPSGEPNCKGTLFQNATDIIDVIPYGTPVKIVAESSNPVVFNLGNACNPADGATVTSNECDFTMAPGDALGVEVGLSING
jgi:hypothetical protein